MADLIEAKKIHYNADGSIIAETTDPGTGHPRYEVIGPTFTATQGAPGALDFVWGAGTIPGGSATATITHGLGAQPSLIMISPQGGGSQVVWPEGATAAYIGVRRTELTANAVPYFWLAGR
uniref:Uncharacterized protein n=1 Tax=viral metagenome TaxID=1070528 RepID=A0A6H1ZKL7_9ZZZZ